MSPVDPELFSRCIASDPAAWDRLISTHAPLVYAVARAQGLREDQCDDVAQSVFSALVRRISTIRDPQALPAWLIVSAKREAWRVLRSADTAATSSESPDPEADPADVTRFETLFLVRSALEELGGRCQELLTLLFLADPSPNYEVIAQRLAMPVGSIGPTRARCLAKLAVILHDRDR